MTDPNPLNPLDQQRAEEKSPKNQNIYSASTGQIFAKNFTAGFSRALGVIVVYLIFLLLLAFVASRFLLPQFMPLLENLTKVLNQAGNINPQYNPDQVQPLLNQLGR